MVSAAASFARETQTEKARNDLVSSVHLKDWFRQGKCTYSVQFFQLKSAQYNIDEGIKLKTTNTIIIIIRKKDLNPGL